MLKRGKNHRPSNRSKQNAKWHRELHAEWATKGIDRCELCNGTFGLALAHSRKRRLIDTKELYWTVALLCQSCHHDAEYGGHDRMERIILEIIENRS